MLYVFLSMKPTVGRKSCWLDHIVTNVSRKSLGSRCQATSLISCKVPDTCKLRFEFLNPFLDPVSGFPYDARFVVEQ